jgi:hypothetical protein
VAQRQIPGGKLVDEVGSQQFQIPGGSFINETLSASTLSIPANSGAFALSGKDVTFDFFEDLNILNAETLTIIVSGNAAILSGLRLAAATGSFALSVAPSLSDVQITAATTSFALTGFDATLTNSYRVVTAAVGTFTFLGNEVVMEAPTTPNAFPMSAETGSFAFTGVDATLIRISQTLTAETGSFELTGYTMVGASSFTVETGSFVLTGNAATFPVNEITEWTRRSSPTTTWTRV